MVWIRCLFVDQTYQRDHYRGAEKSAPRFGAAEQRNLPAGRSRAVKMLAICRPLIDGAEKTNDEVFYE